MTVRTRMPAALRKRPHSLMRMSGWYQGGRVALPAASDAVPLSMVTIAVVKEMAKKANAMSQGRRRSSLRRWGGVCGFGSGDVRLGFVWLVC